MHPDDWQRIEKIRHLSQYDWSQVFSFHTKEDAGHEQPWISYLAGENPSYPEAILQASFDSAYRRLAMIREDAEAGKLKDVHHWQQANPVTTEALIQLTLGGPQIIYNGGLLHCSLRYFDSLRNRPGLPQDVAALVERIEPGQVAVRLLNLSHIDSREIIIQAGAFGEHRFSEARYDRLTSQYPGDFHTYTAPELAVERSSELIQGNRFHLILPPASTIRLELGMDRFVNNPSILS